MSRGAAVSVGIAWRYLVLVRRMPSVFLPALIMPLFILIATTGAFQGIASLPVFAGVSYLAFTVPLATVMGAGFTGINSGLTLARDIEGGFADRLVVSPVPRLVLIAGPTLASCVRSVFTTTIVLLAALIGGLELPTPLGLAVVYLMATIFAAVTAGWSMGVALRTRSIQSAPLMQVVVFLAVFMSVAYAPRQAFEGWLRVIADVNPVTQLMETSRQAVLATVTWGGLWPGLLAGIALLLVFGAWAVTGLRKLGDH